MKTADIEVGKFYRASSQKVEVLETGLPERAIYSGSTRRTGVRVKLCADGRVVLLSSRDIRGPWLAVDDERQAKREAKIARLLALRQRFEALGFILTEYDLNAYDDSATLRLHGGEGYALLERLLALAEAGLTVLPMDVK